jgi:signal transduction histidine kinase
MTDAIDRAPRDVTPFLPAPPDAAARLAALRATALLDTPAEHAFDRLTRLAARLLRAPIALVSLVDEDRQFFKSCVGLPEPWASLRGTPISHSFCQHAVALARPLVIEDARTHPLVRDNPAIHDLGVIAYAGIPLATADGAVLGSFCVIDAVPRRWSADEVATLADLAASVMTELELRTALRRAEEARAEAAAATRAKDDLLAFVTHELRTPLTGIAFNAQLLAMGTCGPLDERQARAVERIDRSQRHLLALTNQLLDFRAAASGRAEYAIERVDVGEAVADALGLVGAQLDAAGVRTECPPARASRCGPTRAGCGRSSSTCWATRPATRRPAARSGSTPWATRPASGCGSATRGRGSPPTSSSASSSRSRACTRPARPRRRARGSASRSAAPWRAGWTAT